MKKETNDLLTLNSLIIERKVAFANLVRAYLKFNVPSAKKVEVAQAENKDVFIVINDNTFKFDVADYTGATEKYIFYKPSNGRIVIQNGDVKKIYKLEVNLYDE